MHANSSGCRSHSDAPEPVEQVEWTKCGQAKWMAQIGKRNLCVTAKSETTADFTVMFCGVMRVASGHVFDTEPVVRAKAAAEAVARIEVEG